MAGDQFAVVFDTAVPFDGGSCQVADHTDQGAYAADYGVFQHLTMGGSSVNDAQACRAEDAANGSFDGFLRTQDRSHFVFTDQHADAVCAGIAAPGTQKDEPHYKLSVRKIPGQVDEREHDGYVDDAEIRRHHLVCGEFRIAEYIHVPLNTATGIVSRMERAGLVERTRSEQDKRIVLVVFSEKGKTQFQQLVSRLMSYGTRILCAFSAEELKLLNNMMAKVREVLKEEKKKETGMARVRRITIE